MLSISTNGPDENLETSSSCDPCRLKIHLFAWVGAFDYPEQEMEIMRRMAAACQAALVTPASIILTTVKRVVITPPLTLLPDLEG